MHDLTAEVTVLDRFEFESHHVQVSWLRRPHIVMVEVATPSVIGLHSHFELLGHIDPNSIAPHLTRTGTDLPWPAIGSADERRLVVEAVHIFKEVVLAGAEPPHRSPAPAG